MVKDLLFFLLAFSVGSAKKSLNLVSFSHSCYVKRERESIGKCIQQNHILFSNSQFHKTNHTFLPNLFKIGYFRDINNITLVTQWGKFISAVRSQRCAEDGNNLEKKIRNMKTSSCYLQHVHYTNCLLVGSEANTYLHRSKVLLHRVEGLLLASSWVESWGIAAGQTINLDRGLQTESLTQVKILTCAACIAFGITLQMHEQASIFKLSNWLTSVKIITGTQVIENWIESRESEKWSHVVFK